MSFIKIERANFSGENEELRFAKQKEKCALCSEDLIFDNRKEKEEGAWEAHHIDGDNENNDFDNLACLCIKCHLKAHGGSFATGKLLPKSAFTLVRKS